MWYLIVPPIVIIISVLFLLWYLSEKGSDPSIAEKVSHLDANTQKEVSFLRTKKFLLHILEKMIYRFKVKSLQIHNVLSSTTQSLKEKSKSLQREKEDLGSKSSDEGVDIPLEDSLPEFSVNMPETEASKDASSHSPERFSAFRRRMKEPFEASELSQDRPMVSDKVARPEAPYRKIATNVIHEESLIAHIASNPKDFSSYEKLGDYYLAVGNIKDAKECYKQVLKLSPAARLVKIKIRRLEKIISEKG